MHFSTKPAPKDKLEVAKLNTELRMERIREKARDAQLRHLRAKNSKEDMDPQTTLAKRAAQGDATAKISLIGIYGTANAKKLIDRQKKLAKHDTEKKEA